MNAMIDLGHTPLIELAVFVAAVACSLAVLRMLKRALARYQRRFTDSVGSQLADAFVFIAPERLWLLNALAALVAVGAVATFTASAVAAVAVAFAAGLFPRLLLNRLRYRRQAALRQQLPDAMMMVAGGLRAGNSLAQAIGSMVAETAPPVSQEFDLLLREQRLGRSLQQALAAAARRYRIEEMALFAAAVHVAGDAGGSLAEALERLSDTLRAALALEAKIDALTAQGRLQAWVMVALPGLLALALFQLDPLAMQPLLDTAAGRIVCATVAVLDVLGLLWIRRLMRIDP